MKATAEAFGYRKGLKRDAYNRVHEADDAGKRALLEAALTQLRIAARCLAENATEINTATLEFVVSAAWGIEGILQAHDILLTGGNEPAERYEPLPHPLEDQDGGDIRRPKLYELHEI